MMTRLKRLVRSAKCVVLSAVAATALGSTAFGDNSRVTAKSYVQKNLIAHWDGVNNDGKNDDGSFKEHNASATSWTDLVAGRQFTLTNSSGNWGDKYLNFSGKKTYGRLSATDTTATFGKVAKNGVYEAALYAPKKGSTSTYWIILKSTADVAHMVGASYNYMRNTKTYPRDLTPNVNNSALTATVAAKYCSATANDYVGYTDGTRKNQTGTLDNVGGDAAGGTILGCRSSASSTSSVTIQYPFTGKIYAVRLYDSQLSDDEIKINNAIDKVRFYGNTADVSTLLPTGWDIGDDGLLVHRFEDGSTLTDVTEYDDYSVQFDADATVAVSALPGENAAALTVKGKKAILKGNLAFTLPAEGLTSRTYTLVSAADVDIPAGAVVTVSSASETFTCKPLVTATEIKVEVTLSSTVAVTARIVEGQLVYYDADGNVTTGPEGGMNDKIKILFSSDAEYQALAEIPETLAKAKGVALGDDVVLTEDANWSVFDFDQNGHVIDLKGHKLTVSQLTGGATITDSSLAAYDLLDYIYGNASQYVDTKYILKSNDVIDARMYIPKNQNRTGMLLGCSSSGKNYYLSPCDGPDYFRWKRGNTLVGDKTSSAFSKAYATIVDIRTSGDTFTWKNAAGDTGSLTATGASIVDCDRPCYILGENDADGKQYCSAGRIYSFTITSGGTVVRQFIPARRKSDNALGLIDLAHVGSTDAANPEFYTRSGSGSFTAGSVTNTPAYGELHLSVASGEVTGGAKLTGMVMLVKDGAGTFTWGSGTAAASCPILVTNGVFKMGVTTADVFGNGGAITVKDKGQFDLNQDGGTAPTINRTFYIEGDGPDDSGAIVNNNADGTTGGQHLKTVYLTGDATIGGCRRIDFRGSAGACLLSGEGHVLTIKNTGRVAFCEGNSGCNVDRIVVDGGFLQPCVDSTGILNIKQCIELKNGGKLISWGNSTTPTFTLGVPVTVGAGGGTIGTDAYNISITAPVTVEPGCTATVAGNDANCWVKFADVEVGAGATLNYVRGKTPIVGTLSGSGAITGTDIADIAFGNNSCWDIALDVNGETNKVDFSFSPVGLNKITVLCGGTEKQKVYDLAPAGELTYEQMEAIKLEVTDELTQQPLSESYLGLGDNNRLVLTVVRGNRPTVAHWTGAALDNNIDNSANWACTNVYGEAVDELPCEFTAVYLKGDLSFDLTGNPGWKSVTFESARLARNCNFSGIELPLSGVLDLNGKNLVLTETQMGIENAYEVTDTSAAGAGGELHVDVADGAAVSNTTVTLSGTLKLVKKGAGTFVAAKPGQTYAGGTEIAAGRAEFAQSGNTKSPWSADRALFGASGSTITVDAGARLNVSGTKGLRFYDFVLAGGTLSNENYEGQSYMLDASDTGFGNVTLTDDSTLLPLRNFVFNQGVLDLGGHTLTIDFQSYGSKAVYLVGGDANNHIVEQQIKNGTIRVVGGDTAGTTSLTLAGSGRVQARGVTLHMVQAKLDMSGSNLYVGDYISEVTNSKYFAGRGGLYVSGTFRPTTGYFYGCTLQNGSTLDLTAQSGVWNMTSLSDSSTTKKTIYFAENATVYVKPGSKMGKIANWTDKPDKIESVTFVPAPGTVGHYELQSDGLYRTAGLTIILR